MHGRRDFAFAHLDGDLARDRTSIVRPRARVAQIDDDADRGRATIMESLTSEFGERGVDRGLGDVGGTHPDQFLITTMSIHVSA